MLLLGLSWALASPGEASGPVTIDVPSISLTDAAMLAGESGDGRPVTLTGKLRLPVAEGPVPAVILLHGSGGRGGGGAWSEFLASIGVASLRLDSYTARELVRVDSDLDRFPQFQQIFDAYRAADVLAALPEIDGGRIAVMGFSRGGSAALYGALRRFHAAFGPEEARIVAWLPFYPACNMTLDAELDTGPAPIRIFTGAADDWTPAAPCEAYVAKLQAAGRDVDITVYPDAHHGFDNPAGPALFSDPDWQTSRSCWRIERDGILVNADTGQEFTYADPCVEYGPHVRFDPDVTEAARTDVRAVLTDAFDLAE